MILQIPFGGGGNSATSTNDALETPPGGGLQARIQALPSWLNQERGIDVPYNVQFAARTLTLRGNET